MRRNSLVQTFITIFRNNHVNMLITSCIILMALYLTVLAAFGRNFIHPFTGSNSTRSVPPADSAALITSAFSILFLLITSLCVGRVFHYTSLPPLLGRFL
ncbi:hypothetical protein OSTOST_21101 [Ostertagia ostertagi]